MSLSIWLHLREKAYIFAVVDGAIHAAAGPGLRKECEHILSWLNSTLMTCLQGIKLRGAKTSQSKITRGHLLPASVVSLKSTFRSTSTLTSETQTENT
jgi:hypothetical protein